VGSRDASAIGGEEVEFKLMILLIMLRSRGGKDEEKEFEAHGVELAQCVKSHIDIGTFRDKMLENFAKNLSLRRLKI
tara:strand:- start:63 stop:293 length:231 start_codon:yes stop_codon:yes gene_type:complete